MDAVYVLLLALTAIGFFLQIEWLLLASIFLFIALVFSRYYSGGNAAYSPSMPPEMAESVPAGSGAQPPIVVVQSGGGAATISDSIIAQMMGQFMAMDAYEKRDQAPQFRFLSRGMKMRQGMFDEHTGKVSSKHKAMDTEQSNRMISKLDEISKKLDKR
jgi:hypothetical protein